MLNKEIKGALIVSAKRWQTNRCIVLYHVQDGFGR